MKNKIIVKAETTSFAYVTLHNAAYYSLQAAKDSVDGRFFNYLTAMVFSAFSLEAYLNHLGTSEFLNWVKIERSKSPKQKLEMLTEKIAFSSDFSKPPFETFDKIFKFRKQIAHGKTERVRVEEIQDGELGDKPKLPHTLWEIETNLENAKAFVEDSKSIIQILHPKFGYQTDAFLRNGIALGKQNRMSLSNNTLQVKRRPTPAPPDGFACRLTGGEPYR
jgi:hypothetical protein